MSGTDHARSTKRRLLVPAFVASAAFCVLVGLGVWQLQRMAWKDGIIAEITARMKASPSPLPPERDWATLSPDAYEYRHVRLEGIFDKEKQALVFRPDGTGRAKYRGPGYLVMTPLRLTAGGTVIVDRGYVPAEDRERVKQPLAGKVTITGLMRPPEPRNYFTPADDPVRGRWFTRDPGEIAAHFGLARAAPFSIDADAASERDGWPEGGQTVTDIPNDHLTYALTWFGLAATLLGVFLAFAFSRPGGTRDVVSG